MSSGHVRKMLSLTYDKINANENTLIHYFLLIRLGKNPKV